MHMDPPSTKEHMFWSNIIYRFSADGGSPPSASQRSPRAPSPQKLPTSRLADHSPTGLGNPGSLTDIYL